MTSKHAYALLVPFLMFTGLTLVDDLHLVAVVPLALWPGLMSTSIFYISRRLECPLWLAKQFHQLTAFATLLTLTLMYKLLENQFADNEAKKVLVNIQHELDAQKDLYRSTGSPLTEEEKKLMKQHQDMMKSLKDPFL